MWTAFCLDRATYHFGSNLKAELESQEGKTSTEVTKKRQRVLSKWLDLPQRFRSPGMVGPTKRSEG